MSKRWFSKNVKFCIFLHKLTFFENPCFFFFIISLVIFGLQGPILLQIKALEILYWPYFIIFSPRVNICWAIMSRICIIFFTHSLELRKQFLSHILIFQRFDQFFSFFYECLHFRQRYWCIRFHTNKNLWIWYHFIGQNFQIHFVNVFFTHPLVQNLRTQS